MKTKKIMISGLAFDNNWFHPKHALSFLNSGEATDMARLQHEAKLGWMVKRIQGVHYICEEHEPTDVKFSIDYCDHVDEDYFKTFEVSGWVHVDSVDYIHLFKASLDAVPLVSDMEKRLEKMMQEQRRFGKFTLMAIGFLLGFSWLTTMALSTNNDLLIVPMIALSILGLIAVMFTLLPFFGYFSRVRQLKKKQI